MTLLGSRRRFTPRPTGAMIAALEQQRDRAIGKARALREATLADLLRRADARDEDARYLAADRRLAAADRDRGVAVAHGVADELRAIAKQLDEQPHQDRPTPGGRDA